jgi:hypothetical protein
MFLVKPYNAAQITELVPMARHSRHWIYDRFGLREYLGR